MREQLTFKRFTRPSIALMTALLIGCAGEDIKIAENPAALYQQGEFAHAAEIWERQAQAGDPSAQFNLSTVYQSGRGVDRDLERSRRWLKEAALNNYAPALHNLALIEIEKNQFRKAQMLLEKAAEQDFSASLYTLGKFHQDGIIGDEKPELAAYYVEKAAKSGLDKAQYNLGKMYRDGYGVEQSDRLSFFWFLKAAEQGNGKAQVKVAQRYAQGLGVAQDKVRSMAWIYWAEKTESDPLYYLKSRLLKTLTEAELKSAREEALLLENKNSN